ncbi:MAG: hypothetical protein ACLTDI_13625 [Acutalibacteraceae bacterium]
MSKEMTAVSNRKPLMHISKRDEIDMWKAWAIRLGAVLLSLVVCAGVIYRADRAESPGGLQGVV